MTTKTEITAADIIEEQSYAAMRRQRRSEMIERKKNRRLAVGPNATLHFENFDTMLYQVQEMLHTEKGGEAQLADELAAYNPLIPKGNEIVGTFMLEFEDPETRPEILRGLTGIEETIALDIGGDRISADWEMDVDRTAEDGKTSSIHFIRFRMTEAQSERFRDHDVTASMVIEHANYRQSAPIDRVVRNDLAQDL